LAVSGRSERFFLANIPSFVYSMFRGSSFALATGSLASRTNPLTWRQS
jgi:hypothetical protein